MQIMKKAKITVLVVDDEPRYLWTIRLNLEARGYLVLEAQDGETALDIAVTEVPDLVLLDIRMPDMNGYQVCKSIREFSSVPIIMLTAMAEDLDKVRGLDLGADDYITKPFSSNELLARVRAVLRRVELSEQDEPRPVYRAGDLEVDFIKQQVSVAGDPVHLTPIEYRLLSALVRYPGRVLVPEYLLGKVWGVGYEGENRLLRQAIYRLRRKIEPDENGQQLIQNRPALGYVFVPPE
jgi:DNA-binding response OmpR family regulator